MSEENSPSPEASAATKPAPRVRRISNPRPKKTAAAKKAAAEPAEAAEPVVAVIEAPTPAPKAAVVAPEAPSFEEANDPEDWPESEAPAESSGGIPAEGNKRKRRRRKGKGGQNANGGGNGQNGGHQSGEEVHSLATEQPQQPAPSSAPARPAFQAPPHSQQQHQHHPQQQPQNNHNSGNHGPRNSANPEVLAKKAWKIFLAEVSEEGVALISDHDARELSKRCFRLAEIFIEEQGRKLR
jgi:hypothetical protein